MKLVVITGVSRGIGLAAAVKFLAEGWSVIGTSTSGKASLEHQQLQMYKVDYLDIDTIHQFAKTISDESIDVLVNNAGILLDEIDKYPLERNVLLQTLAVNLLGTIELTQSLLPIIRKGGCIINLSSGLGSIIESSGSEPPAYKISKAGINMFTRTLAQELKQKNITVSSIDPGWVKTDMGGSGAHRDPSEPANEIYELATTERESGQFWLHGKKRAW